MSDGICCIHSSRVACIFQKSMHPCRNLTKVTSVLSMHKVSSLVLTKLQTRYVHAYPLQQIRLHVCSNRSLIFWQSGIDAQIKSLSVGCQLARVGSILCENTYIKLVVSLQRKCFFLFLNPSMQVLSQTALVVTKVLKSQCSFIAGEHCTCRTIQPYPRSFFIPMHLLQP